MSGPKEMKEVNPSLRSSPARVGKPRDPRAWSARLRLSCLGGDAARAVVARESGRVALLASGPLVVPRRAGRKLSRSRRSGAA